MQQEPMIEGRPEKEDIYGFMDCYFPELDDEPFVDSEQQWSFWERFVDLLCMISLVMKEEQQPESLGRIGSLLNDSELVKALEPSNRQEFPHREEVRRIFDLLLDKGRLTLRQEEVLPLWQFFNTDILQPVEIAAFLFAACVDRNRKYERAFGVLMEEKEGTVKPTVGLVHDLCCLFLTEEENQVGILLDEDTYLNRFLMEPIREGRNLSRLSRPLSLRRQVLSLLLGFGDDLGVLSSCAQVLDMALEEPVIGHEKQFDRLLKLFSGVTALKETALIRLEGPKGVGKKFLMSALSAATGMEVLCLSLPRLLSLNRDRMEDCLVQAALRVVHCQGLLYLDEAEQVGDSRSLQWVLTCLQDYVSVIFLGIGGRWPDSVSVRGNCYPVAVDHPSTEEQKRFWEYFAKEYLILFTSDVNLEEVVSVYDMTPEKIRMTLQGVSMTAETTQEGFLVTREALREEVRRQCGTALSEYAARIESPFVWEDLQLSDQSEKLLREVCDRVRLRSVVNTQFGFGKKLPYGNGTSVVFYGPPGTGKTMAAQVLANELGLDIYRIDLSQIGSKYVGETEKNLGAVFDAARHSNAILFFDEADALFTKRTDVSSSNDRYANAETAYLLQKIEEYSGVSILATNVMQNFDNAFRRRMTFMIPIEQPDEAARLALWKKVFPKETPMEENVDFTVLAQVAELTGSGIKSAALSAAYRAAAGHRKVTNEDLIQAVDFECRRTGRTGVANELYGAFIVGAGTGGRI